MKLHPGWRRAAREIEQDLVDSDPCLNALFLSLTRLATDEKMPDTERIKPWPLRLFARLRRAANRLRSAAPVEYVTRRLG